MHVILTVLEAVKPLQQTVVRRKIKSSASVIRIGEVEHTGWSNVALAKLAPILPPLFLCLAQVRVRGRMCCS
jgi:hypothetical protein